MKGGNYPLKLKAQHKGYTIVEVMIVLAVSGFMFVIAASFINGKQARASFTSGANEMASRIQGTIDEVNDGRFSDIKLRCFLDGTSVKVEDPDVSSQQGNNAPCVFMGKFMHFNLDGNTSKYETFLLAGQRLPDDVSDPHITPVISSTGTLNLTTTSAIPQGLTVKYVKINGSTYYGLGFMRDPADGTRMSVIYGLSSPNQSQAQAVATINNSSSRPSILSPSQIATLCITDGTRYGTITVGEDGASLRTKTNLGISSC